MWTFFGILKPDTEDDKQLALGPVPIEQKRFFSSARDALDSPRTSEAQTRDDLERLPYDNEHAEPRFVSYFVPPYF